MEKFFIFIFGMLIGFACLKYTKQIYGITGRMAWAEKYLGTGGSISAIRLIGVGVILLTIVYVIRF